MLAMTISIPGASAAPAAQSCTFVLGFATLRDMVVQRYGDIVGSCLEDEHHNPLNGDGLQQTTGGLLVWRKADNWTAFTDGTTTYLNGPEGLAVRPNSGPLFPWEHPGPVPTLEPAPPPPPPPPPPPAATPAPATTPVPNDALPTVRLDIDDHTVSQGETIRITVTGEDDKGMGTLVWYASDTDDSALRDTHTMDCVGANPCRNTWEVSTQDTGDITIHAYVIDNAGQRSNEETDDLSVSDNANNNTNTNTNSNTNDNTAM